MVVISPKSYNKPVSMTVPGKCTVIPFSATEPRECLTFPFFRHARAISGGVKIEAGITEPENFRPRTFSGEEHLELVRPASPRREVALI